METAITKQKTIDANLVVSGILCYISTARHVMKRDEIIRSCLVFYEGDDILRGKDILYEIVGEKSKQRRNENRLMNELQDVLDLLKKCEEEAIDLPSFVVDSCNSMPPSSGFDVVAHSMHTLDEISTLKKEIECLKENRLADDIRNQQNVLIQEDLLTIKGEIRKLNLKLVGDDYVETA